MITKIIMLSGTVCTSLLGVTPEAFCTLVNELNYSLHTYVELGISIQMAAFGMLLQHEKFIQLESITSTFREISCSKRNKTMIINKYIMEVVHSHFKLSLST